MRSKQLILLTAVTILTALEATAYLSIHTIQQFGLYETGTAESLAAGSAIKQTLDIEHANLNALVVYLGSYGETHTGHIDLQLKDHGQLLQEDSIETTKVMGNHFYQFKVPLQKNSAGNSYQLDVLFLAQPTPGVVTSIPDPEAPPEIFYVIPQYQVQNFNKLQLLAERINISHGGLVPAGVVYLLFATVLWIANWLFMRMFANALELYLKVYATKKHLS